LANNPGPNLTMTLTLAKSRSVFYNSADSQIALSVQH